MKKIGILGGTFDPFHLGHETVGKISMEQENLDRLMLMPANVSPFKVNHRMIAEEHRLNMLLEYSKNHPEFTISRMEIDAEGVSYTFDTMLKVREEYSECKVFFICGADAMMTLDSWYKGIDLLKNIPFIVAKRVKTDENALIEKIRSYENEYGSEIVLLDKPVPDISSTEIKNRLAMGQSIHGLVPVEIERYIDEYALYR